MGCTVVYMFKLNSALDRAAQDLRHSRQVLDASTWRARKAAIKAHDKGAPETVIAEKLGVSRTTVRSWLGK